MRGRRNKPDNEKIDNRPSRAKSALIKTIPIKEIPQPPKRLKSKAALEEWDRLTRNVGDMIHPQDLGLVEAICRAWGSYVECMEIVDERGFIVVAANGLEMPSPYVTESRKQLDIYVKLIREFGATPFARLRISETNKGKQAPKDPMEELLQKLG